MKLLRFQPINTAIRPQAVEFEKEERHFWRKRPFKFLIAVKPLFCVSAVSSPQVSALHLKHWVHPAKQALGRQTTVFSYMLRVLLTDIEAPLGTKSN